MTISFSTFPSNLRLPLVGVEFDTSRLSSGFQPSRKILVIGQRLTAGAVTAGVLTAIGTKDQADSAYGRQSMLAAQIRAIFAATPYADIRAIALDDSGSGAFAAGAVTFTAPATAAGTLYALIGGVAVNTGITAGMTAAQAATAFAAAVTATDLVPVTAAVDGSVTTKVNLTARHKGECGNDIDIRINYYTGQATPAGLGVTITAMSGGTGNPSVSTAIAALGAERWDTIVMPYTDAANMVLLEAELTSRWQNIRVKAGLAFCAFRGNYAATGTFGHSRNSGLVSCMPTNISPTPPYVWAAVYAAAAHLALGNDPARQLATLALPGVLPPAAADRWDDTSRNNLLYDGVSTYTVDSGGLCRIERAVTMYQTNPAGVADNALLDIMTPATMIYMAIDLATYFSAKYPRHKLANDGTKFGEGQAIVTPKILTAEFLMKALEWEEKGLVEDIEQFKRDLVVERDKDNPNRANALVPPNIVNNLMQLAILLQPRQ